MDQQQRRFSKAPGQPSFSTPARGLLALPGDVLARIAQHLSPRNRLDLSYSCRAVLASSRDHSEAWWGSIRTSRCMSRQMRMLGAWLERQRPAVKMLCIEDDGGNPAVYAWLGIKIQERKIPRHLRLPTAPLPKLQELQLLSAHRASKRVWAGILAQTQLTKLVLGIPAGEGVALPAGFGTALQRLRSLALRPPRRVIMCDTGSAGGGSWEHLEGLTELTHLELRCCILTALPAVIATLSALESLDLSGNPLSRTSGKLHKSLRALTALSITSLTLGGCGLGVMPAWLSSLSSLRSLDLQGNEDLGDDAFFNCLPQLAQMKALHSLCLRGCGLRRLPAAVTLLSALHALDLGDTRVGSREWLPCLSSLHCLSSLSLRSVVLCEVPAWLGSMTRLKVLDLGQNFGVKHVQRVSSLTALTQLGLASIWYGSTPAPADLLLSMLVPLRQLRALDLSDNQLGRLDLAALAAALPELRLPKLNSSEGVRAGGRPWRWKEDEEQWWGAYEPEYTADGARVLYQGPQWVVSLFAGR